MDGAGSVRHDAAFVFLENGGEGKKVELPAVFFFFHPQRSRRATTTTTALFLFLCLSFSFSASLSPSLPFSSLTWRHLLLLDRLHLQGVGGLDGRGHFFWLVVFLEGGDEREREKKKKKSENTRQKMKKKKTPTFLIFSLLLVLTHKFPAGGSPAAEHARTGRLLFHFLLVYCFKKRAQKVFRSSFFSLFFFCARFFALLSLSLSLNAFFPSSSSNQNLRSLHLWWMTSSLDGLFVYCLTSPLSSVFMFFFRLNAEVVEKAMSVFFFVRDV